MNLKDRLKSKYASIIDTENRSKLYRLLITILSCIVLLVVLIVSIINHNRIDAADPVALLFGFRLLLLTGVAVTIGIFIILVINRVQLEWHFLVLAFGIGAIYMFAMTPLSGADEPSHFINSTHLSGLIIDGGRTTFSRISDFDFTGMSFQHNVPSAYLRLMEDGVHQVESERVTSYALYYGFLPYPVQYLPQAIGISLGRLLQLNFFGVFYLGRFFNLLFFVLCGFFAVRALKEFKLPILIIGILPMTLHQAASFSPDSVINGASILFIAYLVRCLYEREEWSPKDIAVLAISGILLAPAKNVYFVIVLLLMFAAPYKCGWRKAKGYVIAGAICAVGVANILFFNLASLQSTAASADVERWHGGTNYTLSFIFENPFETFLIFLRTLWHFGEWYLLGMFGRELAGLSIVLPAWYIYVFMIILAASIFYGKKGSWIPKWLHRGLFFIVCAVVVFLSLLGMFLAWTPDTHPFILGVQGRYFIPILPLAALLLRNKLVLERRLFAYALLGTAAVMHFVILRFVLDFTISQF